MTQLPDVAAAIRANMLRKLEGRAAPVALSVLVEIASDGTAPKAARVAAANSILDRAGYTAQRDQGDKDRPKSLAEMTADELAREVRRIRDDLQSDQGPQAGSLAPSQVIDVSPPDAS